MMNTGAAVLTKMVIMGNAHEYCEVMCGDILSRKEIIFVNKPLWFRNLFRLSLARMLKNKFREYRKPGTPDLCFIFFDSNPGSKDGNFLKYLRKHYGAKLVLYVMNPVSSGGPDPGFCLCHYDAVFTVFPDDAKRLGWHVCGHMYSAMSAARTAVDETCDTDVFFAGRAKDRLDPILQTYDYLTANNIKCDFHVFGVRRKLIRRYDGISYNRWMPYRELLKRVCRSRCILEILQKPGTGPTLRMAEAVVYDKKLITNDAAAAKHPFYDDRFMQIFDKPDKIGLDFITDGTRPEYNYRGQYSANYFLKLVEETLAAGHLRNRFS